MKKVNFEERLQVCMDHLPDGLVKEAALYSLLGGGKRLRPQLLFTTLDAYHISQEKGVNIAIAMEMIHTYSLIHDDLPAMDDDDLRRGKPTCHKKYGEAIAILAGDALLSEAFYYANKPSNVNSRIMVEAFVQSCGLAGMIYGQELDIRNVNKDCTVEELKQINIYKTSKLITLPFVAACIIADSQGDKETWVQIGNNLGLAFQIQDDILDVSSTPEQIGKPTNSDIKNNKHTYVSLLGIERCHEIIEELMQESIGLLDTMMIDKDPLVPLFQTIAKRSN